MFMFREKNKEINTAKNLQKEAKKFQKAVAEINSTIDLKTLTIDTLKSVARKYGIEVNFLKDSFKIYLKNNALNAVRQIKAKGDYTILDLERAVKKYGFELEDLNITYFSQE